MNARQRTVRHLRDPAPLILVPAETEEDSGPACLAAVLTSLGRRTTLEEARRPWVGSTSGPLVTLVEAGRSFGLEMVPTDATADSLRDVPVPQVVELSGRFVILERRRGRNWTVVDPVAGRRQVSRDELDAGLTGTVVTTSPGPGFFQGTTREPQGHWRMLVRLVRPTPGLGRMVAGLMGLSLLMVSVGFVSPVLTQLLIDQVLPERVDGVVPLIALGLGLLILTTFLASYLRGRILVVVTGHLDDRLMTSFFAHLISLPFSFFRERSTGDLVQRFASNAVIRNAMTQQTIGSVLDGLLVVVYAGALFWISPAFGLAAISIGALQVVMLVAPARRTTALTEAELEQMAITQSFTVEAVTGAAYLKASGLGAGVLTTWSRLLSGQIDASMRRRRFTTLIASASTTVSALASSALLLLAVSLVLAGDLSLGTALALVALSSSFLGPLTSLIVALQSLQAVQGHVDRLAAVLVTPREQAEAVRPPLGTLQGRIELRDVSFRYGPDDPWAVRHVSLTLEPGQRVAVVGSSGSGKSTMVGLVLGLHVPEEGTVLVDGIDVHTRDLGSFRRQCGVVLQEPVIFDGTIRDNVSFGEDQIAEADIDRAVRLAHLDADLARMPDGLDTVVDERGTKLSGGQRQRVALARAMARRPGLLVLDEATGALDALTEAAVNRSLREEGRSTFVIAHRLSTVREADLIVVLEGGSVVEQGTHAELVAVEGQYARLVAEDQGGTTRTLVDAGPLAP